ncbi:hypothetical protein GMSM_11320 [Geomonas sp. Red276]
MFAGTLYHYFISRHFTPNLSFSGFARDAASIVAYPGGLSHGTGLLKIRPPPAGPLSALHEGTGYGVNSPRRGRERAGLKIFPPPASGHPLPGEREYLDKGGGGGFV